MQTHSVKNRLMQLYADNAAAPRNYKIENANDNGEATVYLYDAIGEYFGISPMQFADEFSAIDADVINLRIHSPGGDVFGARAMTAAIMSHRARVIAHVDGLAASAATYVATSADEVRMVKGSFFMIHNGWTLALGDKRDLRHTAGLLEKVDGTIVDDYLAKIAASGKDTLGRDEIVAMMDAETWLTADEALDYGFTDAVFDGRAMKNEWKLQAYANAPAALMNREPEQDQAAHLRAHLMRRVDMLQRIG